MLDQIFACSDARTRLRGGPLGDLLDEYATYLRNRGHGWSSIRGCVWAVAHFGLWLQAQCHSLLDVNPDLVRSFLRQHLPECCCPSPAPTSLGNVRPGLRHLLRLLNDRAEIQAVPSATSAPIVAVVEQFRLHLRDNCGLAEATCLARVRYAREFLEAKFAQGTLQWEILLPSDVMSFVAGYAKRCQPTSAQVAASALRSFLRYLQFQGWCGPSLAAAVPRLPHWRLAQLPRTMTDEQLNAFLLTFDRSTATGRRDYAMALCQADLGLRVSEVAGLRLEALDWRAAILRIATGKAARVRLLPLAARSGQAIADYLRHGRPTTACRHVFVRHHRRSGMPVSTALIQGVMRLAYTKVPGCEHCKGTHVLRHTAATRLHQRGANFKQVADVLGHRSIDTTAIYAKVDLDGLTAVALPWPEVQR